METHERVDYLWRKLLHEQESAIDELFADRAGEDQWLEFKRADVVNARDWDSGREVE
jgi:hypothetical protein